jgi:hypothetical protein
MLEINIIELVTTLAHNNVVKRFNNSLVPIYVPGTFKFVDEVQKAFDEKYTYYWQIIFNNHTRCIINRDRNEQKAVSKNEKKQ